MALKIFTIIMVLFVAELTFLATKEPKKLKTEQKEIVTSDIEFNNLSGASIDENGLKNSIKAKKAIKFKTHDELFGIDASFTDEGLTHSIKAKKAIYQNNNITFENDVFYENNQSLTIKTQNLEYNTKKEVASSSKPFILTSKESIMSGDSFIYDMKNKNLKGTKLHYIQEVDER
jgi:LPS export ABC transporter protein LptC